MQTEEGVLCVCAECVRMCTHVSVHICARDVCFLRPLLLLASIHLRGCTHLKFTGTYVAQTVLQSDVGLIT
jgi:hypothetical protein